MLIKGLMIYLAGLLDISIGIFVYLKNRKAQKNIAFLFLTLSIGIWSIIVAGFFLTNSKTVALFLDNTFPLTMTLISTSLYYFSLVFQNAV